MTQFKYLGKKLQEVQEELGAFSISPVYDELEVGEEQEYSVSSIDNTWEMSLDDKNRIKTIFLYFNEGFTVFENIKRNMSLSNTIKLLGEPYNFGDGRSLPYLGDYGAWLKYKRENHYLHIEYEYNRDIVKMVTLMSKDIDN